MVKVSIMVASKVICLDYFFTYAILGWMVESLYCSIFAKPKPHWINRGFLYGPYCPIYGFGALIVLGTMWPLRAYPMVVFGVSMVLTSALEYFTSWLLEKMFHTRWWDYSTYRFNLKGRICLRNSFFFGLLGLVVVYGVHPLIREGVMILPMHWVYLLVLIISIGFSIDLTLTTNTLIQRNHILAKVSVELSSINDRIKLDNQYHLDQFKVLLNSDSRYAQIRHKLKSFYAISNHRILSHIHAAFPLAKFNLNIGEQIKSSWDQIHRH